MQAHHDIVKQLARLATAIERIADAHEQIADAHEQIADSMEINAEMNVVKTAEHFENSHYLISNDFQKIVDEAIQWAIGEEDA